MVDADWHDGYEEQAEAVDDYFRVGHGRENSIISCFARFV